MYHGDAYDRDPGGAALEALALFTGATALFLLLGMLSGGGLLALTVAQAIALAGAPIAWARMRGDARARLGLRVPGWRPMLGAVMIGASLWLVNLRLAAPIVRWLGTDELVRLGAALEGPSLALQLVLVALLPAFCEELLCRGVVARALRPALGRIGAVVASALLFAAFHLSLVRFVPTLSLGIVLAIVTLAADSVWPAMVAHAINNALALAVSAGELGAIGATVRDHPNAALAASILMSGAGLVITIARRRTV